MNLTIDVGNTSAKAAIFENEVLVHLERLDNDFSAQLFTLVQHYHPEVCAISNVTARETEIEEVLKQLPCEVFTLSWQTPVETFGLSNIPQGLGADRLAAILGATKLCPATELLVVDAGTCLTYDYISASGCYLGGNISPGLTLRLRAMYEHTALLPLVALEGETPIMGYDTETALRSGTIHGACFEIEGFFHTDRQQRGDVSLIFAGADTLPFSDEVRQYLVEAPQLVCLGLNRFIMNQN